MNTTTKRILTRYIFSEIRKITDLITVVVFIVFVVLKALGLITFSSYNILVRNLLKFCECNHLRTPRYRKMNIPARLKKLRNLKDGWLEGKGKGNAPIHNELDWLAREFKHNYPDELPLPHVYPIEEGGVVMEWSIKPNEVSLEIDLRKHHGEWHCLNMETDDEETDTFDLNKAKDWGRLVDKIRELRGVT